MDIWLQKLLITRMFKVLFKDIKFKPKHHFVEHYPDLIREFGPLINMWTMRFEAKHSYFKRVVHESHCFKNILMTLAQKHQLMEAYHLSLPTYFTADLFVPESENSNVNMINSDYRHAIHAVDADANVVAFLSYVTRNGIKTVLE